MWLNASEALERLNVKAQTLYANVSRGRIAARPDPGDPRRSLYNADDVDRLARRQPGRPKALAQAAEAISWGDPVLLSAITNIAGGRLYYRGRDAALLSRSVTLEEVAAILWQASAPVVVQAQPGGGRPLASAFVALAERAAVDPPSFGRDPAALRADAAFVLATLADALLGAGVGLLHVRVAVRFGRPEAADDIRRALVLLADHELNASTFAARVTVSTGASLAAGALTGLATLSGPLHGNSSSAVMALAEDVGPGEGATAALRDWLGEGRFIPGFGHRLYRSGDPRAVELLAGLTLPASYAGLARAAMEVTGEPPNIDFALAALVAVHNLPREAPLTIFALARCVGWLAHMIEQASSGAPIRPRARYIGPMP